MAAYRVSSSSKSHGFPDVHAASSINFELLVIHTFCPSDRTLMEVPCPGEQYPVHVKECTMLFIKSRV